jgi:TRAP-type C4-dicarboxylate transport system permease small subunit
LLKPSRFIAFVRKLSEIAGMVAAGMIAASIVIVCQMVLSRYVLRDPTTWQTELVTYLLVGATLIGSPYVLMIGGHVSVDLLPHYLTERGRKRRELVSAGAGIFFCGVLLWSGSVLWYEAWVDHWLSETVWAVPLWIPYAALPIGFGLMLLQYVADLAARLTSAGDGS